MSAFDSHCARSAKCSWVRGSIAVKGRTPGRELLVIALQAWRPLFDVEAELADQRIHPSFGAPAGAGTGRGSAIDSDVEGLAERGRVEIGREHADGLSFGRNLHAQLALGLLLALEGRFHREVVREEHIVRRLVRAAQLPIL